MDFLYHYTCNECKKHSTTTNPIILNIRYRNLKCRNCRGEKKQAVVERHVNREKEVKEEGDPFSLIRGDEERGLTREIKDIFNSIRDGKETGLTREVIDNLKEKLENGNIDVNILDETGCTLLMYGCKFGHGELVEILIKRGADPNVEAADPDYGLNPENGYSYYKGRHRLTALMIAVEEGYKFIAEFLLKHGADPNARSKPTDLERQCSKCITGSNVCHSSRCYSAFCFPIIMTAFHHKHYEILELLLKNNANANIQQQDGRTLLEIAAEKGNKTVVEMLLMHNANMNFESALCSARNLTTLEFMIQYKKVNNAHQIFSAAYLGTCPEDIAEYLLENNIALNKRKEALPFASTERIQLLLRYNTPLNDHGHSLALEAALQSYDLDLDHIEFLIRNKAECDLQLLEFKMKADNIIDLFHYKLHLPYPYDISVEDEENLSEETKRKREISKYLCTCFENKLERERRELQSQGF